MKKFCTRCGRQFESVGREVICPACKQAAAEETKRMAVLRAKKASWTGESVPVRISGRASTVIREYGKANNLPFAQALDALLQSTVFFTNIGTAWSTIQPYKSHRRDKATSITETTENTASKPQASKQAAQEVKQDEQEQAAGKPQEVKTAAKTSKTAQAAKREGKATTSKTTSKRTTAGKGEKKA